MLRMVSPRGGEPKRRSHGINELCLQFEPEEDVHNIQLKIDAGEMGVRDDSFPKGGTETETKVNIRIFGMDGRLVERITQPTDARLMPVESGESQSLSYQQ